jgi:hypothetical protein
MLAASSSVQIGEPGNDVWADMLFTSAQEAIMVRKGKSMLIWTIGIFLLVLAVGIAYMLIDFGGALPGDTGEPPGESVTDGR